MIGSILLYAGLGAALLGALLLFVRWKPGLILIGGGVVAGGVALLLPVRRQTAVVRETTLDELVPVWQFSERHRIVIRSPCDSAWKAVHDVTASEITGFRTLTWLRRFGRPGPEGLLNPPAHEPILRVATRTGFLLLGDQRGHELVIGTAVMVPPGGRRPVNRADFVSLDQAGYARAALNFHLKEEPAGCRVTTETRVFATDRESERVFSRYWRAIYPGSALIRRMWLRAIKRRAERMIAPASPSERFANPGAPDGSSRATVALVPDDV
jgi:hypothetical protein